MTGFLSVEMPGETARMNNFSEIFDTHSLAGKGDLPDADSRRGRRSLDASCSGSLPWAMNTQRSDLFPLLFPSSQPASVLASGCEDIDPRPDFGGRAALEMLMGPEVVVDGSNMLQRSVTRCGILDGTLQQHPLHRADEPFDAAVLPGAARVRALMLDAQEPQPSAQTPRREDGFVVGVQEARAAILTAHGDEVRPNRQRRLIRQPLHAQAGAACMVQDGQHDMPVAVGIGLGQQVHAPDQIAGNGTGYPVFQCSPYTEDRILLPSDRVGDVGFADRHAAAFGEAPVEAMGNQAAARVGHEGLEPNDLTTNPFGLGRRMRTTPRSAGPGTWPGGATWASQPAAQQSAQPGAPLNESAQQTQHRDPLLLPLCMEWVGMC